MNYSAYPFFAVWRRKPSLLPLERPQTTIFTALGLLPAEKKKRSHFIHRLHVQIKSHIVQGEKKQKEDERKEHKRKWEREGKQESVCDSAAFCLVTPQPQIQPLTCWRYIKKMHLQWWHFTYQQASRKDVLCRSL